jgi:hypothetical protein
MKNNKKFSYFFVILTLLLVNGCGLSTESGETCYHVQIFVDEEREDPITGVVNVVASVGATVVLDSQETNKNTSYLSVSGIRGVTNFYEVELGMYKITVSKDGFTSTSRSDFRVSDNRFEGGIRITLQK